MINVAIIGVGNCASSLIQGVQFYRETSDEENIPGLMHTNLGGYRVRDINFVAAFDVAEGKVDVDLADAILAPPNNTIKFATVPITGVKVSMGKVLDGIGKYVSPVVKVRQCLSDDVAKILKERKVDVVINYLPVGSENATQWYVEQILEAKCAMINCIPVFIAREEKWQKRFIQAGVPIIGDDIKSQVGATIVHRVLTSLFGDRGVRLDRSYQLNVGGNTDFLNMLERERLDSKKESKTNAVSSITQNEISADSLHVGPSDHVPWLTDRKFCFIRMEGTTFGNVPLELDLHLRVWDSPNSAGVVIDAIRLAKLGLDNSLRGTLIAPSAYLMKSPPKQIRDDDARTCVDSFIKTFRGANPHAKD